MVRWRNGNAAVCKTAMSRLNTDPHLQQRENQHDTLATNMELSVMANFKRKRSRTRVRGAGLNKWESKKLGNEWRWLSNWPAWWDIVFHRRPHRRRAAKTTRQILLGKVDAEGAIWPVSKKPHNYYW